MPLRARPENNITPRFCKARDVKLTFKSVWHSVSLQVLIYDLVAPLYRLWATLEVGSEKDASMYNSWLKADMDSICMLKIDDNWFVITFLLFSLFKSKVVTLVLNALTNVVGKICPPVRHWSWSPSKLNKHYVEIGTGKIHIVCESDCPQARGALVTVHFQFPFPIQFIMSYTDCMKEVSATSRSEKRSQCRGYLNLHSFLKPSRGLKVHLYRNLWENDPASHLIYYPSKVS